MKKKIHKLLLFIPVLFFACQQSSEESELQIQNTKEKNINYFKAVFFATGPLSKDISAIKNSKRFFHVGEMDEENFKKYKNQGEVFLEKIQKYDSDYIGRLGKFIENENHLLLKQHILKGANLILRASLDTYIENLKPKEQLEFYNKVEKQGCLNQDKTINYGKISKEFLKELSVDSNGATCIVWALAYQSAVFVTTYGAIAWLVYLYADFWGPELENYEDPQELSFADGVQKAQTDLCIASYNSNISLEILVADLIELK